MTEPFNLRHARLNEGLTQRALAKRAKVKLYTIQSLESGRGAHPANAKRVADIFGVKVTDLLPAERIAQPVADEAAA